MDGGATAVRSPPGVQDPNVGPTELLGQPVGGRQELGSGESGHRGYHTAVIPPEPPVRLGRGPPRRAAGGDSGAQRRDLPQHRHERPAAGRDRRRAAQLADYELTVGRGDIDGLDRVPAAPRRSASSRRRGPDRRRRRHRADPRHDGRHECRRPWPRLASRRQGDHHPPRAPRRRRRRCTSSAHRNGVDVDFLDIGDGGDHDRVVDAFEAAIDERTRAVVISHVLWSTGAVMPVRAIADRCRDRGVVLHRRRCAGGRCHPGRRGRPRARMPTPSPARSGCSDPRGPAPWR